MLLQNVTEIFWLVEYERYKHDFDFDDKPEWYTYESVVFSAVLF